MERCSEWVQQQLERHDFLPPEEAKVDEESQDSDIQSDKRKNLSETGSGGNGQQKRRRQVKEDDTGNATQEPDTMVKADVGRQRRRLNLHSLVLDLHCGWAQCSFVSKEMPEFIKHVSFHIPDLEVRLDEDDEGVYACLWEDCGYESANAGEITRHVNYHSFHTKSKVIGDHVVKLLNLPQCQYESRGHNFVPDQPDIMTCHWSSCTLTSNNINFFIDHVNAHALDTEPKHRRQIIKCGWRGCAVECVGRTRIIDHVHTHTQEKPVACSVCGSLFSSKTKLEDHLKAQIPIEKRSFQCSNCSRYYPSERLLRDHMRQHVNHYKCRFCDMTCPTTRALSLHIRYRHLDDKPFSCRYCSHKTKTHHDLTTHFLSHIEGKSFQCIMEGCTYSCRALTSLRWHYRKVHSKSPSHSCHMCDQRFYRGAALTKHLVEKHAFHWPSGHSRFRYKEDDDGQFRLQTVRYESLEVTQQIMSSDYNSSTPGISGRKFVIEKRQVAEGSTAVANFVIKEGEELDEYVDDPDCPEDGRRYGASMPELNDCNDASLSSRAVLISIQDVDSSGNIVKTRTLEAEPIDSENPPECAKRIQDGFTFID